MSVRAKIWQHRRKEILSWAAMASMLVAAGTVQRAAWNVVGGETATIKLPEHYIGLSIDTRVVRRILGIRLLVADLIWVDTLIKSDVRRENKDFTDFYYAAKTVVTLDPDNLYAYYVTGLYLSVIKDDVHAASVLMRDGAKYMQSHAYSWGEAWRLPFTLGYNLLFEEHEIEEGSYWIHYASELPNAPQYVVGLGNRVSTEEGRLEIAARVLNDMYRRVEKPEQRAQIEKKMTDIAVRQELADLNQKFTTFIESTGAGHLSKEKQFQLFKREIHHSGKNMMGAKIKVDSLGKIVVEPSNTK